MPNQSGGNAFVDKGAGAPDLLLYFANFAAPEQVENCYLLDEIVRSNFGNPISDWRSKPAVRTAIQRCYAEALLCWLTLPDRLLQHKQIDRPLPVWTDISPQVMANHPVWEIIKTRCLMVIDDSLPTSGYFRHAAGLLKVPLKEFEKGTELF
jgi:hypothetical protein